MPDTNPSVASDISPDYPPLQTAIHSLAILCLLVAVFALDMVAPMGKEAAIPYGFIVIFSYCVKKPVQGHLVTLAASGLLLLTGAVFPLVADILAIPSAEIDGRGYAVASLWLVAAGLTIFRRHLNGQYGQRLAASTAEQSQSETRLKQRLQRYRDFAEASSDGLWETDDALTYSYLSDNFFQNTGFVREMVLGTSREAFIAADNDGPVLKKHMETLQALRPFHDFRYKTSNSINGDRFWSENGKPIFDANGTFRGYRGFSKDITDLVQAETRTTETILQFRSAIENLTDGFILYDRDQRMVICNQKIRDLNSDIADLFVPGAYYPDIARIRKERDNLPFKGAPLSEILANPADPEHPDTGSFLREYKDGRRVIVKFQKMADEGVVITQTDISELVRAREEAEEASRHYRRAFDATPVMLHYVDQDLNILQVNQCWLATLGYQLDEVIGRPVSEFLSDEYRQGSDPQEFRRLLSTGEVMSNLRRRFVTKSGEIVDALLTVVPDQELATEGMRYLVCSLNITEQLKVDRMKGEFVSVVSHELRTPLTSIVGALGLLSGGASGSIPEEMRPMVNLAKSNADRLVRLINDILDVGRIETGEVAFRNEALNIDQAIVEAVDSCRPYADMYDVRFEIEGSLPGDVIWADRDRFVQVLANLLSNAAKFSPAGETVEIGVSQQSQHVRIEVKDKGPGIPREFRNVVFEKFSQADTSDTRNIGGTGLGLNIAQTIIHRMQGTIGFEDNQDRGTTFYIVLPLILDR